MTLFGLVAEGNSDHAVLENILLGLFEEDISDEITTLQPIRGATDEAAIKALGGWYKVFEYCRSEDFIGAFQEVQYLVIQIDTDVSEQIHYDVKQTDEFGKKLIPEVLIEKVKVKFEQIIINEFGQDFLNDHQDRILFAISVDEIECWLLPLYYTDSTKSKTNNCNHKLHQKTGKFEKNYSDYDKISKDFRKSKTLTNLYPQNPSLKFFVDSVKVKNILLK